MIKTSSYSRDFDLQLVNMVSNGPANFFTSLDSNLMSLLKSLISLIKNQLVLCFSINSYIGLTNNGYSDGVWFKILEIIDSVDAKTAGFCSSFTNLFIIMSIY